MAAGGSEELAAEGSKEMAAGSDVCRLEVGTNSQPARDSNSFHSKIKSLSLNIVINQICTDLLTNALLFHYVYITYSFFLNLRTHNYP